MPSYYGWKPYVSVASRRANAQREMQRLRKQGVEIQPLKIEGRNIAHTFWGQAWCEQMESQVDFENRLPRGRTYVRNGSVCHLTIERGKIEAFVSGSEMYNVGIDVDVVPNKKWKTLVKQSSGQIGSLVELLQGRISSGVMEIMTDPKNGLFPKPNEIHLSCDCPDYAIMCKHVAAVLYGVGARLDQRPELLFELRGVNHLELITASTDATLAQTKRSGGRRQVAASDLSDVFGIEIAEEEPTQRATTKKRGKQATQKKRRGTPVQKTTTGLAPKKDESVARSSRHKPKVNRKKTKTRKSTTATKQTATRSQAKKKRGLMKAAKRKLAIINVAANDSTARTKLQKKSA